MESFLNFLWVLIAAVALGFWRMRWQPEQRQARRNSLREWTAMGCALVLLFFAVSLTDDLHSEAILSDSLTSTRSHAAWCSHAAHNGNDVHPEALAVLASPASVPNLSEPNPLVVSLRTFAQAFPARAIFGRAPPESSL